MTQETHPTLKLAETMWKGGATTANVVEAVKTMLQLHALIVQFDVAFDGELYMHDDQRKAITAAKEYLK